MASLKTKKGKEVIDIDAADRRVLTAAATLARFAENHGEEPQKKAARDFGAALIAFQSALPAPKAAKKAES